MALTYREVLDRYDKAKAFGETKTLPEFVQNLNSALNTEDYSQGLRDGPWTRFSTRLDQVLGGASPYGEVVNSAGGAAADVLGALGGATGQAFGYGDVGEKVGRSLPRSLLETAPLYLAGPEAGIPATIAAALGTGLLMGGHTYADTGNKKQALLQGAVGAALPTIGKIGGNVGARLAGGEKVVGELAEGGVINSVLPATAESAGQVAAGRFAGSQLAQLGTQVGQQYVDSKITGTPFEPFTAESIAAQLPFTVFDAVHAVTGKVPTVGEVKLKPQVEPTPQVHTPPPSSPEAAAKVQSFVDATTDPTKDASAAVGDLIKSVMGEVPMARTPAPVVDDTVTLSGFSQKGAKSHKFYVQDSSHPEDFPPGSTVFLNGEFNSTADPDPTNKTEYVAIPKSRVGKNVQFPIIPEDHVPKVDPNQPLLPVRPEGVEPTPLAGVDTVFHPAEQRVLDEMGLGQKELGEVSQVPSWVTESIDEHFAIAQRLGVVDKIVELATQGLVAKQIQPKLGLSQPPSDTLTLIRAVRAKLNIPSVENTTEFTAWQNKVTELKASAENYESAKIEAQSAREIATAPLSDPVAVVESLPNVPSAKAKIESTLGTPTQKVQAAVLEQHGKVLDNATEKQALEKHKVLALWHDREQNEYGGGIVDAEGKRMKFNTRAAAHEYLTEWQADPANTDSRDYVVRNAGRNRGYYLAPIENQQVSMDAVRGEGGESSLHNVVTQASEDASQNLSTPGYDIQDRPEVSQRSTMEQLDHALTHPEAFSEVSDFDAEDAPQVLAQAKVVFAQALKDGELNLKNINSALEAQGLDTFDSLFELKGFRKDVVTGLDGMQGVFRSPTLGSEIPYNRELVSQIGFEKGARNVVDWIVNENIPVISDLVAGFRNFPDILDRVQFVLKGDPRFQSNEMFFMLRNEGPTINIGRFPDTLSRESYAKDLAHEIAHHMDIESAGRTDAAAVEYGKTKSDLLESLRNSRSLPKDVRAVIAKSIKEGWYEKNSATDPIFSRISAALGEDKAYDWLQVIYGLQNEQEMVAQTFSSHQFIALMNETKAQPQGGILRSALNVFSRAFGKLFGLKNESALETLLTSFDNYLTAGNLRNTYNGREFIRDSLFDQGVHPDAVASRLWTMDRLFTKGNLLPSISGFVREGEVGALPPESQKNFTPLDQGVRTALVSGDTKAVYDKTMSLLADQLPAHQELLFRMKQDLEVANGLFREIREGRVPGTIPQGAEKELSLSRAKVSRMEAAMNKQALAVQRWNEIEGITPEGWGRDVAAQLGEKFGSPTNDLPEGETIRTVLAKERAAGKRSLSWFAKTFALTQHFAEIYPAAKTVVSRVSTLQGDAIARMRLLTTSFFFDPSKPREGGSGNVDPEIKKQATRVLKSERLLEVTSDLFRWQNQEGQSRDLNLNDGFVKKRLAGLNDSDRAAVLQMVQSQKNRHITWTGMLGNGLGQMNEANTGTLIAASEPGMLPDTARDLSRQMYSALAQAVQPETAQVGAQSLAALAQKMSADTYLKALQHVQTLSSKTKDYMEYVQKNPGYVSEQRYGSDKLVMLGPDGQKSTDSGTNAELQKIQKKREKEGYSVLDYIAAEDATSSRFGMTPQLLQKLEALDSTNENLVRQMLSPEVAATVLPRISRAGDIRASMAASAPLPTVKRAFREGRENINMLDNANQFYQRSNNWLRNRLVQAESALDMMHPEVSQNPELTNYLNKHVEEFTTPDNPTARKFVEATSFAKLGMDFGNSLIEMTQHLTTGMAELIKETGSVSDAIGLVAKTSKNIWQSRVTKKWANPEHKILDDYLQERGHGSLAHWGDFAEPEILNAVDVNSNPVVKSAGFVKHMAKSWSSAFSGYNDQVIAHAAFDIGRSQGMDIESALQFADSVKARGLYTGGKAQRAVGLWDIKTKAVPQLMNALQSYTLGWFGQMGKNFVLGFGKAPQGLTETQRLGAKKAFAYSLVAQAALAGGLGLPAVGQGLALFSQITGIDGKGWIRQNLAKMFDEDDGGNQILTSLAMRGVGSAGLPFDPSGRVSVSIPFIGVDAYKGFDVANLGGAVTSTVADFIKGGLGLLGGDVGAGAGLLPNVLKRPYQLWQGEGDIRDKRGGLLYKLTPAESVMMALGITPSGVQNQRDAAEAVKKANDTAQKKAEALADDIATTFRKVGDQAGRQKIVEAKQENPQLDVKALLTSVQNRIIAQQQPYDPRRELRSDANIDGLNLGLSPSEIVRQQMAAAARNSVGLTPRLSRPSKAAALDEYLGANPYSSLSGARSAVQTGTVGRGRSSLQTVPAYLQGSL